MSAKLTCDASTGDNGNLYCMLKKEVKTFLLNKNPVLSVSILNIFDYTCTIKRNVWVYWRMSGVAVWQICILSDLDCIFSFSALLAAVTAFERRHFHVRLVFMHSLSQTKCGSKNRLYNVFFLFFCLTGELKTRCQGSWDKNRHRNRHLYCVCRNHHPGVCCLKSLHWGSCVWGIKCSLENKEDEAVLVIQHNITATWLLGIISSFD